MAEARRFTDHRGRILDFPRPPRRIVSLVPSDTLSVADLGAMSGLVGRTDYCVLPDGIADRVPSVGGTKNPRIEDLLALRPDLVLANQEENSRRDLEALAAQGVRIYVAFPKRVAEGLAHLAKLARILDVAGDPAVQDLLKRGYEAERAAASRPPTRLPVRVFCPIWMDPLMTIHGETFISDMIDLSGGQNVFADRARRYPLAADLGKAPALPADRVGARDVRYPRVTMDEVVARAPDLILLPDEPHPFNEEDAALFRALEIPSSVPGGRRKPAVIFADGKDLCWYGSRSVDGIARVRALLAASAPPER